MLFSLLAADSSTDTSTNAGGEWFTWVLLGVLVVAIIAMLIVSSRRNKKRQEESEKLINSVRPGNKVKTIGGVCGIVVEVDDDENTFVLETGSEASGKCYMKFDKQAIYQTDAVVDDGNEVKDDVVEEAAEEQPAQTEEAPADPFTEENKENKD